jgi:L-rhamnose mutarotase
VSKALEGDAMMRVGQVIGLPPENLEEYRRLHADVWPEVLRMIHECNIRNYSIFYRNGMLYAYFEYVGDDYKADMKKMAADPNTREWWAVCGPLQRPLENRAEEEWWAHMEQVFHTD